MRRTAGDCSARTDASDAAALEPLKAEHLAELLAKHLAAEVRRMFSSAPASSHLELGIELSERIFRSLADVAQRLGLDDSIVDEAIAPPPRRLLSVGALAARRPRPQSSLSTSTLFTRSHREPRLSAELAHEIECADRVDVVIEALRPQTLVGLTATPERMDGRSPLPDFGDRVAAEPLILPPPPTEGSMDHLMAGRGLESHRRELGSALVS